MNMLYKGSTMMKGLVLFLFAAVIAVAGENLLKNPDFKEKDGQGKLLEWSPNEIAEYALEDGWVTVRAKEGQQDNKGMPTFSQNLLKVLEPGNVYRINVKLKGAKNTLAQVYVEGTYNLDGKRKYFGSKVNHIEISPREKSYTTSFNVPQQKIDNLYFAVRTISCKIPFSFKELTLTRQNLRHEKNGGYWEMDLYPGSPDDAILVGPRKTARLEKIPVQAGKQYCLKYDITGIGETGSAGYFCHEYGVSTEPYVAGSTGYQDVMNTTQPKNQILTIPEDFKGGVLSVEFKSKTGGQLKIANVRLEEYAPAPEDSWEFFLTEPYYRNTIYPRTDTGRIAGKIKATSPAATALVKIAGQADMMVTLKDGCGVFSLSSKGLADGKYPVSCQIRNAEGQTLKTFELVLRKVPTAAHEVIGTDSHYFLVDGKPFFAVSEYRNKTVTEPGGWYYLAKNGINCYLDPNPTSNEKATLEMLDAMHEVGIMGVLEIGRAIDVSPTSKQRYKEKYEKIITEKVRNHPAFFGYYTYDEPQWTGVDYRPLVWTYEFLAEVDPYHPVWMNHAPRGEVVDLRRYTAGSDITSVDVYPVPVPHPHCGLPDKSLNCIGDYTRRMSDCVYGRKPVWMILQAFNWQDHNDKKSTERRIYPTEAEMRFMYFDALCNGCTGINFYGTQIIKSIPYHELVYRLAAEIRSLSGVFTTARQIADIPQDNPKARVAAFQSGNSVYYFLLNLEPKENKLSFPASKRLIIYREGRQFVPKDGRISVTLSSHEVIICGTDALPPPAYNPPKCNPEYEALPDPFYKAVLVRNGLAEDSSSKNYYQGNANWIWNKEQARVSASSCVLTRYFKLEKLPGKAELLVCCDDEADVFLNGRKIGNADGHSKLSKYDVRQYLKNGNNLLLVNARDGGGLPCGMLAELQFDGKVFLVSDEEWQARAFLTGENLEAVPQTAPTVKAFIVAPYGEGAWKRNTLLP